MVIIFKLNLTKILNNNVILFLIRILLERKWKISKFKPSFFSTQTLKKKIVTLLPFHMTPIIYIYIHTHIQYLLLDLIYQHSIATLTCVTGFILERVDHMNVFSLMFLTFAARFFLYSIIRNPIWVLPVELLNGITYALTYSAAISYAAILAPPGAEGTLQGVVGTAQMGIGLRFNSIIRTDSVWKCFWVRGYLKICMPLFQDQTQANADRAFLANHTTMRQIICAGRMHQPEYLECVFLPNKRFGSIKCALIPTPRSLNVVLKVKYGDVQFVENDTRMARVYHWICKQDKP